MRAARCLSIVVERLGDLFEPRLCDVYEELFTQVIQRVCPELDAARPATAQSAIRGARNQPTACTCSRA